MPLPPFDVSFKFSVANAFGYMAVCEFSGAPSALDKITTNTATSTTATTGATGVLSQADEVVVSFVSHATPQIATYTGGFSTLIDRDDGAGELNDGEIRYLIATATTTRNDSWTVTSEEWAAVIASFRSSAGALLEQSGHRDANSVPDVKVPLTNVPKDGSMLVVVVTAGSGLPVGFCRPVDSYGNFYNVISEFVTTSLYVGMWAAYDFKRPPYDYRLHPHHMLSDAAVDRGFSNLGTLR